MVLAPEIDKNEKGFFFPDFFAHDQTYYGSNIRMQAAVELFKENRVESFIVVGGPSKKFPEVQKTEIMKDFLIKNGVPAEKIIAIVSEPNTQGNFKEVYSFLRNKNLKLDESRRLGFLTNFWHIPRATKFMFKVFKEAEYLLEPIAAESIIKKNIENKNELLGRLEAEIKGMQDIEKGEYKQK